MKRKLGPLQLWQWIMIGAAVGIGTVLYRRGHAGAAGNALAAVTPSGAQFNPIDPTTGLPISGGMSSGAGASSIDASSLAAAVAAALPQQQAPGDDLATTLSNFGSLETLLSGLSEIQGTPEPGDAVETSPAAVETQTGTKRAKKPKTVVKRSKAHGNALSVFHDYGNGRVVYVRPARAKAKRKTSGGDNPGHHVTHHGGGKKTASSSAPHNSRQHQNVQPPAHQRHEPTTHHSAQHPAVRTSAHHATPAAHPPAKRAPVRRPAKRRR